MRLQLSKNGKGFIYGVVGATLVVFALALAGCGESREDAGINNRDVGPADIINMPDGFSNVAHKCDGPNMVYVIYHGSSTEGAKAYGSVAVVANDPRCAGAAK